MCTLIMYSRGELALAECLEYASKVFKGGTAVGFLSTPKKFLVAKVKDGQLEGPEGPVDLSPVFEARIFSTAAELRWLAESGGRGRAVVLTETECSNLDGWSSESRKVAKHSCEYMLWGKGTGVWKNGWSGVSSARIGTIPIPAERAVGENQCVFLKAVEYLCNDLPETDGNCVILDERLLGLEVR